MELYFESLCPYCQDAITGSFAEAFSTPGFLDMADVLLVPFGNAHEYANGDSWTFTCQHGDSECVYNEIENCSNKYISDPLTAFNFINCVESNDKKRQYVYQDVIDLCTAPLSAAETASINSCWNSEEGIDLHHASAQLTAALVPAHECVPWMIGQGVHTDDIQSQLETSLLQYVCDNYTGDQRAAACDAPANKIRVRRDVCYKAPTEFLQ